MGKDRRDTTGIDRRRALHVGAVAWTAPVIVITTPARAVAASGAPTFTWTSASLVWEMPKASSNFFLARYTLSNDGTGPGEPRVVFYAAAERISLFIDRIDPNWVVSAGPAANAKTLTWVGPAIPVGGTVVLGGTDTSIPGYFRGTVANNPPHLGTSLEGSNFSTAATVSPPGGQATIFYDGDNYP